MQNPYRTHVFVSYSHLDQEWLVKLRDVFAPDIRNDRISYWDDRDIKPGNPWYEDIGKAIDHARVALLLVSSHFLASRFIMEEELPRILKASGDGLTVLWIPLYGTFYGPNAPVALKPISKLQAVIPTATPLADLPLESIEVTLRDLCRRIQTLLNPPRIPRNLPFTSLGSHFRGRDHELAHLEREFQMNGSGGVLQPQAITGMGGIGKTRLAVEYAWRRADAFTASLFVSANTPADLATNLARLSEPLDLMEYRHGKREEQESAVLRWLQQNKHWFLILDNVDTLEAVRAVKALLAKLHGGHILITTRITGPKWGDGVRQVPIGVISHEAAVAFLLETTEGQRPLRSDDSRQASLLAETLGCLPLALSHASAYIRERYETLADYLNEFEQNFAQLIGWFDEDAIAYDPEANTRNGNPNNAAIRTIAGTFFLSFDCLGPLEKALLRAASWLASDPIPVGMFEACPDETKGLIALWCEETGEPISEKPLRDAFATLARYSLIGRGDGMFTVHRLEQAIVRSRATSAFMCKWGAAIQNVFIKYAPREPYRYPNNIAWRTLAPHADALWVLVSKQPPSEWNLDLPRALALFYMDAAPGKNDIPIQRRVLEETLRRCGPLHAESLTAMNDLALMLQDFIPDEALNLYQQALKGRRIVHGDVSMEVAETLSNIGYMQQRDASPETEAVLKEAILVHAQTSGAEHWRTLATKATLSAFYSHAGQHAAAESTCREVLQVRERVSGARSVDTLASMRDFGVILHKQGRIEEALRACEKAASGFEEVEGLQHPDTCMALRVLAHMLFSVGEYSKAKDALDRLLHAGCDSSDIRHHLARLCLMKNDLAEAREHVIQGWATHADAKVFVIGRLLWLQLTIELLGEEKAEPKLQNTRLNVGRLKTALHNERACREWTTQPVLDHLKPRLSGSDYALLAALAAALNDRTKLPVLDQFAEWRNATPQPLD
jgi:tetratricopeptide (TPR) repeat protein